MRNGPNQTIFASSGLRALQIVLEPDIGRYVSEDVGLQGGGL